MSSQTPFQKSTPDRTVPTGAEVLIPAMMVIALSFLAIAVPLHFSREWVELGWIAVASLLWFFSCRLKDVTFTVMSLVFFLLAGGQILVVDLVPLINFEPSQIDSSTPLWPQIEWPGLAFSVILMLTGVATITQYRLKSQLQDQSVEDRVVFTRILGGIGLWLFWFILTMELIHYFQCREHIFEGQRIEGQLLAAVSLSLFWVFFARVVQMVGFSFDSIMIRRFSVCMFSFVVVKMFCVDLWLKPLKKVAANTTALLASLTESFPSLSADQLATSNGWVRLFDWLALNDTFPVWNLYALPLLTVACVMIGAAISAHKRLNKESHLEKTKMLEKGFSFYLIGLFGLVFIWLILSVECYCYYFLRDAIFAESHFLAVGSLTLLWTVFSLIVFGVGVWKDFLPLRIVGQATLMLTAVKSLLLDFSQRPESYTTPVWNHYGYTVLGLVLAMFFVGFWTNRSGSRRIKRKMEERSSATFLGVIGIAILWLFFSQETYLYFRENTILSDCVVFGWRPFAYVLAEPRYFSLAILSILWAVFGLTLFVIGMKGNSYILRGCGYIVLLFAFFKSFFYDLCDRPESIVKLEYNFSSLPMLCVAVALMMIGICLAYAYSSAMHGGSRQEEFRKEEKAITTALGVLGLILLLSLLSVECFTYFHIRPKQFLESEFLARMSLTVLWTVFGAILLILGVSTKSIVLRTIGLVIFLLAAGKSLIFDLTQRPETYLTPFWNPFAVPMLFVAFAMIFAAVWSTRIRPAESKEERNIMCGFGLVAVAILWMLLSVESSSYFLLRETLQEEVRVHFAAVSVSLTWLLFAAVLFGIAIFNRSEFLRYTAIFLSVIVIIRFVFTDLFYRPDFFEPYWIGFYVPVLNTYMLPLFFLSLYLMIVGIIGYHRMSAFLFSVAQNQHGTALKKWEKEKYQAERDVYKTFAFCGLAVLLVSSSIECFRSFNSDRVSENLQLAQMSLSILWSVFGGVLLFIGFRWRSSILRWCSIILLTFTTIKVFCVDLASIHEEYRIGAFFTLAVILVLAARAYQRFRPEG